MVLGLAIFLGGCASGTPYLKLDQALQKDVKVFNGGQYIPLVKLCDVYGLDWKWDPYTKSAVIERKGKIALVAGSDSILINGALVKLDRPVIQTDGAMYVPISFMKQALSRIVEYPLSKRPAEMPISGGSGRFTIRSVVIDPGHGGKDPGAIGGRLHIKERDLTLAVSKRLKNKLEENGMKVIITRDTDTFIPLPKRADIANRSGADLFISVHINASRSRAMNGFECYYLSEATDDNARALEALENASIKLGEGAALEHSSGVDKALWDMTLTENRRESAALASYVCSAVESSSAARNRGIRTARFSVLKGTRMPAVLLEMGYISNRDEERRMTDDRYWDRMIDAVAQGILAYRSEYERTEGFTN
jgi:N-acetylmuramoyl-L-alanine amidase